MSLVGGIGSIGQYSVWNVKVSGIIYPSLERVISTTQYSASELARSEYLFVRLA